MSMVGKQLYVRTVDNWTTAFVQDEDGNILDAEVQISPFEEAGASGLAFRIIWKPEQEADMLRSSV